MAVIGIVSQPRAPRSPCRHLLRASLPSLARNLHKSRGIKRRARRFTMTSVLKAADSVASPSRQAQCLLGEVAFQPWIEPSITLVGLAVRVYRLEAGLDAVEWSKPRLTRLLDRFEPACSCRREYCDAVRRSPGGCHGDHGDAEDVGLHLTPECAARASANCYRLAGIDSQAPNQLE